MDEIHELECIKVRLENELKRLGFNRNRYCKLCGRKLRKNGKNAKGYCYKCNPDTNGEKPSEMKMWQRTHTYQRNMLGSTLNARRKYGFDSKIGKELSLLEKDLKKQLEYINSHENTYSKYYEQREESIIINDYYEDSFEDNKSEDNTGILVEKRKYNNPEIHHKAVYPSEIKYNPLAYHFIHNGKKNIWLLLDAELYTEYLQNCYEAHGETEPYMTIKDYSKYLEGLFEDYQTLTPYDILQDHYPTGNTNFSIMPAC